MTFDQLVLMALLVLPLGTAIVVAALGPQRGALVRYLSLGAALATLLLAFLLAGRFMSLERRDLDADLPVTFQPEFVPGSTAAQPHQTTWNLLPFRNGAIQFYVGVDGLNIWLIVLTAVLTLPTVLVSWTHITERVNEFYAWLLALKSCMLGIFLSFDIVLFYVFFEVSLVPLFFLIGIWGGPERRHAARKFFIYTLSGSVITLLGVLGVVLVCADRTGEMTFSIPRLVELVHQQLAQADVEGQAFWANVQFWVFLALMAGFAIKVPLVPFHTWLPLAHVEAPTAGSVDLAGVLLKIGAYGFLRLCIPLAPDATLSLGLPLIMLLATIGIVYGALCAYSQVDVKRLIAYSSVSHLGLCMLGMFSLTHVGLTGSLLQMINHGLSTGALFLLIGMLYERYHTRMIADYGGLASKMPWFAVLLVFICLSSVAFPGLNGFIGEVLCLFGSFQQEWHHGRGPILSVIACSGIVLGAWYLFTMMRCVLFGPFKEPPSFPPSQGGTKGGEPAHAIEDLKPREWVLLAPIVVLCLVLGLYPQPVIQTSQADIDLVGRIAEQARQRASGEEAVALPEKERFSRVQGPRGKGL